jgi:hypothetical protein
MASSRITAAFARRKIHYGWVVVAVTFLTLLVTAAAMGTPGVMIVSLEREFGGITTPVPEQLEKAEAYCFPADTERRSLSRA